MSHVNLTQWLMIFLLFMPNVTGSNMRKLMLIILFFMTVVFANNAHVGMLVLGNVHVVMSFWGCPG